VTESAAHPNVARAAAPAFENRLTRRDRLQSAQSVHSNQSAISLLLFFLFFKISAILLVRNFNARAPIHPPPAKRRDRP
jgi:hypothetical protein